MIADEGTVPGRVLVVIGASIELLYEAITLFTDDIFRSGAPRYLYYLLGLTISVAMIFVALRAAALFAGGFAVALGLVALIRVGSFLLFFAFDAPRVNVQVLTTIASGGLLLAGGLILATTGSRTPKPFPVSAEEE